MNRVQLISFTPGRPLHAGEEAERLKINISLSQSELYALVLESAHKSHAGNYTCDIATLTGVWEKEWELIITGVHAQESHNQMTNVCVCVCGGKLQRKQGVEKNRVNVCLQKIMEPTITETLQPREQFPPR